MCHSSFKSLKTSATNLFYHMSKMAFLEGNIYLIWNAAPCRSLCLHSLPTFASVRYVLSALCLSATGYATWEHQSNLDPIYSLQRPGQTHQLWLLLTRVRDTVLVKLSVMPCSLAVIYCRMLSLTQSVTCVIREELGLDTEKASSASLKPISIHYWGVWAW